MTTSTKNIISILLFAFSLLFLIAATNMNTSAGLLDEADCHHCGSVSACESGGQAYGYHDCNIIEHPNGQIDCGVMGNPNCGSAEPPKEDPID